MSEEYRGDAGELKCQRCGHKKQDHEYGGCLHDCGCGLRFGVEEKSEEAGK